MQTTVDDKLDALLDQHEKALRIHYMLNEEPRPDQRVETILRHHKSEATGALARAKLVRDDILVYFKALELTLSATEQASTHAEKNARLRGVIELLQQGVEKLRQTDFTENTRSWFYDDVFRTDNPTRRYVERIHELEDEVKRLKHPETGSSNEQ